MKRVRIVFLTSFFSILVFAVRTTNVSAVEEQRRQITLPPSIPKVQKPPAASLPPQIPKVPQVPKVWDTSITQTQRELEEILRIHQVLQVQQQAQLREIQRITEQAEVHQKILSELKTSGSAPTGGAAGTRVEDALRVQKIALIQEQARENRLRLKRLQRKAAREKKSKGGLFKSFREQKLPFTSEKEKEKE